MGVHIAETTVDELGRVVLDHLPFAPGDKVEVVIRSHEASDREQADLPGSVIRYDDPLGPVANEDWDEG